MKIGVLSLQGDYLNHINTLKELDISYCKVRYSSDFDCIDGLIIPGGESTTMSKQIDRNGLRAPIKDFGKKYNNVEHIMFDAVSYNGILDANQDSFGIRALPSYSFDKADIIVSFGADFLGNWGANNYSADYHFTQDNITEVGTIGGGTWQGTAIADAYIASAVTWNAKQAA